jgi:hypothetical protein
VSNSSSFFFLQAPKTDVNKGRYQTPKSKRELVHDIEPEHVAIDRRGESLDGYIRGQLGNNAISHVRDNELGEKRSGIRKERREDKFFEVRRQEPALREDRRGCGDVSGRLQNFEGVLNDGTRKPFIERLEELRDSIQKATESVRARATRITENVQGYLSRERESQRPSENLKWASKGIEQSTIDVGKGFQQEMKQQVNRSRPSMGR